MEEPSTICPECRTRPEREGAERCHRCGLALSSAAAHRRWVGHLLGSFRVQELRRHGPQGSVFAALDERDGRWRELLLRPGGNPAASAAEGDAHPGLVRVLETGESSGVCWLVRDVRPDERRLSELTTLPLERAVWVVRELAGIVSHLHEGGFAHGALCPDEVLLDPIAETVRLSDRGHRVPLGGEVHLAPPAAPAYAAPEREAGRCEAAADIYALGALLVRGLWGEVSAAERAARLAEDEALPPELRELIRAATAPEPSRRPASARALQRCLQAVSARPRVDDDPTALEAPAEMVGGAAHARRSVAVHNLCPEDAPVLAPEALARLPLPLARAALRAWNARPGLPRQMVGFCLWEGVARLLAGLGCALLSDAGCPLPVALQRRPFRPSFGSWVELARDALEACPRSDPLAREARELLIVSRGGRKDTLLRFLQDLVQRRNEQTHLWPEDEELDLLTPLLELVRTGALFQSGALVGIARASLEAEDRVRYQPVLYSGAQGAYRGQAFRAGPGLRPGRVYWRRGGRFLELDPFWICDGEEVLILASVEPGRARYTSLDRGRQRLSAERFDELFALLGGEVQDRTPRVGPEAAERPSERAPDPFLGRMVGGVYRVVEGVGQGGMGTVYRGWDTRLRREVALKLLIGGSWAGTEERQRFLNEARVLATVGHPNLVRIYEVGEEGGCPFSVMELLPGPDLARWTADRRGHPRAADDLRRRVSWMRDAARALHACHEAGVVHRDVKPSNLVLDGQGRIRVLDFGLAHVRGEDLTVSRARLGTPRYMAPEQILDAKRVGAASDVYGLGMSLYALLAERKPFAELRSEHDILTQAQLGNLPRLRAIRPELPEELETIVAKATQPREERRYASAADLAEDLERWLEQRPIAARPAGVIERTRKYCRRHPVRSASLAMLAALVLTFASMSALLYSMYESKNQALFENQVQGDLLALKDLIARAPRVDDFVEQDAWIASYEELESRIGAYTEEYRLLKDRLRGQSGFSGKSDLVETLGTLVIELWPTVQSLRPRKLRAREASADQVAEGVRLGVPAELTNSVDMKLRLAPAGAFRMGSPPDDKERFKHYEVPFFDVTLTRAFYIGALEVTQKQFVAVLGRNPSRHTDPHTGGPRDAPVDSVSWPDAIEFCNKLSDLEGLTRVYTVEGAGADLKIVAVDFAADGYRLPTEAEWEYACRAGSVEARYGALEAIGWGMDDNLSRPRKGGRRDPNSWGLYDTLGNVSEWCWDIYQKYPLAAVDPTGPLQSGRHAVRGGNRNSRPRHLRAAMRAKYDEGPEVSDNYGLRVVRTIPD